MGEGTAQAVEEIEEVRGRLEAELTELEARLPEPVILAKRLVGIAVGGGIAGAFVLFALRRVRRRRRSKRLAGAMVIVPRPLDPAVLDHLRAG